jgi:hypothetical protein
MKFKIEHGLSCTDFYRGFSQYRHDNSNSVTFVFIKIFPIYYLLISLIIDPPIASDTQDCLICLCSFLYFVPRLHDFPRISRKNAEDGTAPVYYPQASRALLTLQGLVDPVSSVRFT